MMREAALKKAAADRRYEKLCESNIDLKVFKPYVQPKTYYRSTKEIPSLSSSSTIYGTQKEKQEYSGEYITGLATMHKSNIVPVGRGDDPKNYSTMRRN